MRTPVAKMLSFLGTEPKLEHDHELKAPANWEEADKECERIEKTVIAIYEKLIADCPDPALMATLKGIQASNYRHLNAVSK
jgi:rubrerythrin